MLLPDKQTRLALGPYLPNLAGYWSSRRGPVPQTGTMLDLSGRGNNITLGSTMHNTPGAGISCDAASVGTIADNVAMAAVTGITINIWVLGNVPPGSSTFQKLIFKNNAVDFIYDNNILGGMTFRIYDGAWQRSPIVGAAYNAGQYNMVTGTYDQLNVSIWVNGVLYGSTAVTSDINVAATDISIGGLTNGGEKFSGHMDEIMWFRNCALPAANIRALYETQRHLFGV